MSTKNSPNLRRCLQFKFKCIDSVVDDVTSGGREFHDRDAAAGKARSPIVRRRVEAMAMANDDAERRRRRPGRSVTGCRTDGRPVVIQCCTSLAKLQHSNKTGRQHTSLPLWCHLGNNQSKCPLKTCSINPIHVGFLLHIQPSLE